MLHKKHKLYLKKFISDVYLQDDTLTKYKREFLDEIHVKHCVFEDFLNESYIHGVKKEIENTKYSYEEFYTNNVGYKKGTGAYVAGNYLSGLHKMFHSRAFYEFMKIFYEKDVYTPVKIGFVIENIIGKIIGGAGASLQIYNAGDYLHWHTDGPADKAAGSFVLFLTPQWKQSQGGALEFGCKDDLRDRDAVAYKSIYPQLNTFVFFKCEEDISWHRVGEVVSGKRITYHDQLFYK